MAIAHGHCHDRYNLIGTSTFQHRAHENLAIVTIYVCPVRLVTIFFVTACGRYIVDRFVMNVCTTTTTICTSQSVVQMYCLCGDHSGSPQLYRETAALLKGG